MTEKEKMMQGLWYDANYDELLLNERSKATDLCFKLEHTPPNDVKQKNDLYAKLLPYSHKTVTIATPFSCDYGYNIHIGECSFLNRNCYLMDGATITIGNYVFLGPNCGLYTAIHPLKTEMRSKGLEMAKSIRIGDNAWIGGHTVILAGIAIGDGSVIGAGSVVTKDIPANVVAVGNPCRVIREIKNDDRRSNHFIK